MLPGIKGSSKSNKLVALPVAFNSLFTNHCQIYDQTKSNMVKGIDNAFDHMELCLVLNYLQKKYFSENWLVLP